MVTQSRCLRSFLDEKRIPYILCQVDVKGNTKEIRGNTIPKGWMKWSYDKCCKYNKKDADPKCKILNVNLRGSGYVVVDIDRGDVYEHFEKYGTENQTKSIRRGMPHLWFERSDDDEWNDVTNVNDTGVDYRYTNVFEHIDAVIENYDPYFDEFDWEKYLGPKPEPKVEKPIKTGNNIQQNCDTTNGDFLLDLISPKFWTDYHTWRNLIWACIEHFGMDNGIAIAILYSKKIATYTDGCVEKVAEYYEDGKITWGTAHHYARESNPDGYAELMAPKIKPDDETLAELFLYAFGQNITKDINGDDFIFFHNQWTRANKDTSNLIRGLISKEVQKIIEKAFERTFEEIDKYDMGTKEWENLDKRLKKLSDAKQRIRSNAGTKATYEKVKDILELRQKTNIVFDIGDDQLFNIQFKNGVYELNNKRFRPRTKEDYVTMTLDWNYSNERNNENMEIVNTFFKKVQPDPEMNSFLKTWLAYCLTGDTSHEVFKMNIGKGSNGKTAEFSVHMKCFPLYCLKVDNRTFCEDYTKRHKQLIRQVNEPIRMTIIEEMKMTRLDEEGVKDYTNGGNIPIEIMHGTSKNFRSQSKLNTCSQHEPNMRGDGGVIRRGLMQFYLSTFVEGAKDDYEKHIYKKILNFDKKFDNDEMKLAYFHVLIDNYKPLVIPSSLRDNFKKSLEEGDNFKNVFEDMFEITEDENRIAKSVVQEKLSGKKQHNWRENLAELKRLGCIYSDQKKVNGKKGCFLNVREIMDYDEEDEDPDY
jgi:hypothetical protein